MHHPEKAVLDATAGTGNTATRILMKDGLYVMGTNAKPGAKAIGRRELENYYDYSPITSSLPNATAFCISSELAAISPGSSALP